MPWGKSWLCQRASRGCSRAQPLWDILLAPRRDRQRLPACAQALSQPREGWKAKPHFCLRPVIWNLLPCSHLAGGSHNPKGPLKARVEGHRPGPQGVKFSTVIEHFLLALFAPWPSVPPCCSLCRTQRFLACLSLQGAHWVARLLSLSNPSSCLWPRAAASAPADSRDHHDGDHPQQQTWPEISRTLIFQPLPSPMCSILPSNWDRKLYFSFTNTFEPASQERSLWCSAQIDLDMRKGVCLRKGERNHKPGKVTNSSMSGRGDVPGGLSRDHSQTHLLSPLH